MRSHTQTAREKKLIIIFKKWFPEINNHADLKWLRNFIDKRTNGVLIIDAKGKILIEDPSSGSYDKISDISVKDGHLDGGEVDMQMLQDGFDGY